jgi:hypothetical protein
MVDISFATQAYQMDALPLSAQRCVNAYCEFQPKDAKSLTPIFGSPGIMPWAEIGEGPIRGLFSMNGIGYAVSRDKAYSFDEDGVATLIGDGITGNGVVSIDGNGIGNIGNQVIIVNGELGFVWDVTSETWTQISNPNFHPAETVTFLDGYFILDWKDTNKFYLSNLLDGTTYGALAFASAESSPDRVVAVWNRMGLLLVFGERTIEPWQHTGAYTFPFQRIQGGTIDRGLIAPRAIVSEDTGVFFLGNDHVFYRMQGLQLQRISTHALEREWELHHHSLSDATCFAVGFGGHKFIYLRFPSISKTWGYDIATGLWHERQSYDPAGFEVMWRVNCAAKIFNHELVGDANSNKIGHLVATTYTEFGDPTIMDVSAPPIHGAGKMVSMPMFELDMSAGQSITTGQGSDAQVMLDWSDDGGHTFIGPQLWKTLGKIGAYKTRLRWDRNGSFYQRTLRVRISDPVFRCIIAARCPDLKVG